MISLGGGTINLMIKLTFIILDMVLFLKFGKYLGLNYDLTNVLFIVS